MKKFIIYLSIVLITPSVPKVGMAQNSAANSTRTGVGGQANLASLGSGKPITQTFDDRYDGIKGNPFFYDNQYHEGELWLIDSTHFTNEVKYRFDQLKGLVQVKYPDGKEMYLNSLKIRSFLLKIENKDVTFINVLTPNKPTECTVYQIIYHSPTLKLLRNSRKKLSRVNDTGAYSKGEVYDEIRNDYTYFIQQEEKPLTEVKLSRKSFIKAMPEKERKIENIFNSPKYKGDLTVSKLGEIMQKLDEPNAEK